MQVHIIDVCLHFLFHSKFSWFFELRYRKNESNQDDAGISCIQI